MEHLLTPAPECWPRAWAPFDASDALAFWLTNPLLLHHYPKRMPATAARAATLTTNADKLALVWRLRELRLLCRTRLPLPQGLPTLSREDMMGIVDQLDDVHERREVRSHSLRLSECELPWLAARVRAVLAARAAAASVYPFRAAA